MKRKKRKAQARLIEELAAAGDAVPSPCPHFPDCGGCLYLNCAYEKTLRIKETRVKELLTSAEGSAQASFAWEGILESPRIFGYRNKMEFSFGDAYRDGPLALGMHRRGSFHDIVSVPECRITDADYRRILRAALDLFSPLYAAGELSYYHRTRQSGYLRHLLVRKATHTGEILIDLVTTSQTDARERALLDAFCAALYALPLEGRIVGILHTVNDSVADAVKDGGTELLSGRSFFDETLCGLSFQVTPFSFFQTNSLGAEVLYETVRRYAQGPERVRLLYDLYCGTGTIAQLLAKTAERVVGVELSKEAVQAAKQNAARNGLANCTFLEGDVLQVLDTLTEAPELLVLDPPRDGVHPKALPKLLSYGVPRIVYVSCKAESLARDMLQFFAKGYRLERAVSLDQFPWTENTETVALFVRAQ